MLSLSGGQLIDDGNEVDMWQYLYYGERPYFANPFALLVELLEPWRGRYLVHEDMLCWHLAIQPTRFRYSERSESMYSNRQVRWERRTLSALVRFVQYHLMCCYNLREMEYDRLIVHIQTNYARLEMCHGFLLSKNRSLLTNRANLSGIGTRVSE